MSEIKKSASKNLIKKMIPILSILLAIILQIGIPNSVLHPQTKPYFTYVLVGALIIYFISIAQQKNYRLFSPVS